MTPAAAGDWRRGVTWAVIAMACFAALDSTTQMLGSWLPLAMVVWARFAFLFGVTAIGQGVQRGRALWRTRHPVLQVLRGLALVGCSALGFASLRHVSLGDYTAILMLTPLAVTAAAARLLGERVPPMQWLCLAGAFAGAMLVIRPGGEDLGWAGLMPLGLVVCNTAFQLLTGRLARDDDVHTIQLYTGLVGMVVASAALPFAWATPPHAVAWAVLLAMCLFAFVGHLLLTRAYAAAPASKLTPLLYLQIGFAIVLGWLAFDRVPDAWSWAGIVLITVFGVAGTRIAMRLRPASAAG